MTQEEIKIVADGDEYDKEEYQDNQRYTQSQARQKLLDDSGPRASFIGPENPNEQLGFEISAPGSFWSFVPDFYPSDFTQSKETELKRYGGDCNGESVSIKKIKNREVHVTGKVLESEVSIFNTMMDTSGVVDLISPLTPNKGLECHIKQAELGNQAGVDPFTGQRVFEYKVDLVSTGKDEYGSQTNDIVSSILGANDRTDDPSPGPGPAPAP